MPENNDSGFRFLYWDDLGPQSINNNPKEEEQNADS